jgi:hypothetical protein
VVVEFKDLYLPIIMAVFLGYIAYQQMSTNKSKLKLDLYNKRFDIYSAALKFHQELMSEGLSTETHRNFIEAKQSSKFLFHPKDEIYEVLNEIHTRSFKVTGYRKYSGEITDTDVHISFHNDSVEALDWIIKEIECLDEKMSKYLNFHG